MIRLIRKTVALVAGLGVLAGVFVYVLTFFGLTLKKEGFHWFVLLHVGVFVLIAQVFFLEGSAFQTGTFFWKKFAAAMPRWAVPLIKWLGGLAITHFVLFLVLTRATSPEVKDGQYVLNNHGQITGVLSEEQYLRLKEWELRMFAAYWIFFYTVPALYWWFPRGTTDERLVTSSHGG
jgi:hypothetical protein